VQVLGRVLLLQLIDNLVRGYRDNETWSLQLLNSTRIHILPTMNPDGFDEAGTHCQLSQGRYRHTQKHILAHLLFLFGIGVSRSCFYQTSSGKTTVTLHSQRAAGEHRKI